MTKSPQRRSLHDHSSCCTMRKLAHTTASVHWWSFARMLKAKKSKEPDSLPVNIETDRPSNFVPFLTKSLTTLKTWKIGLDLFLLSSFVLSLAQRAPSSITPPGPVQQTSQTIYALHALRVLSIALRAPTLITPPGQIVPIHHLRATRAPSHLSTFFTPSHFFYT